MAYCINVKARRPKVELLDGDALDYDLKFFGVKRAKDLDFVNLKHKVFEQLSDAENFLKEFTRINNSLDNKLICKSRELPTLRMPRAYIVLALMGEKTLTERRKTKNWKPGQLFNIQDQTFFLTVRLKKIAEIGPQKFIFHFVKA